ncbi:helix-turn-helix transcriptional regulator [Streptomyces sp. 7N604]|uniref:helix-turn-helix transcriptional regulator n=1 Tax=Streptomyces sp. 7N604 TaxID=3457415 RepID=UPI003FD4D82B
MSERFDAIDALLARPTELPPPDVRAELRRADGLTQAEVAEAIGVSRLQVIRWEQGQAVPRRKHRAAYAHLLKGLAAKHPGVAARTEQLTREAG